MYVLEIHILVSCVCLKINFSVYLGGRFRTRHGVNCRSFRATTSYELNGYEHSVERKTKPSLSSNSNLSSKYKIRFRKSSGGTQQLQKWFKPMSVFGAWC